MEKENLNDLLRRATHVGFQGLNYFRKSDREVEHSFIKPGWHAWSQDGTYHVHGAKTPEDAVKKLLEKLI